MAFAASSLTFHVGRHRGLGGAASSACRRVAMSAGPASLHELSVKDLEGTNDIPLSNYKGKAVLAVNVACACGYTKSGYATMKNLADAFKDKLQVIAFPSNDFGAQEPGSPDQIRAFVQENFGSPNILLTEKSVVSGPQRNAVFALAKANGLNEPSWNFDGKMLFDTEGKPNARFTNSSSEAEIKAAIEKIV